VVFPGVLVRFNGQRPRVRMAPRLGEHTDSVLAEARAARSKESP
jgi:crotonobetainyl-CoA:carnitine CoA-transferase CaiB-like acyl-CoA transferase